MRIFTAGHAARSREEFVRLLHYVNTSLVVDIRTIPRSRHNPQFNRDTLPEYLAGEGIGYRHIAGLGGLRHPRPDSSNIAWQNESFRGFADYMQTEEFNRSLAELVRLAETETVAIICAETLPWRCHRSLIADALVARGVAVTHILNVGQVREHRLTPWAKITGERVTYPSPAG